MSKKILLVEDEAPQSHLLSEKLKTEGLNVLLAKNGEEGLALALSEHPDLILADIIMPRKDGISMLEELRNDKWGKTAKVIMLTNLSNKEAELLEHDVVDFLVKSDHTVDEIINTVIEKVSE